MKRLLLAGACACIVASPALAGDHPAARVGGPILMEGLTNGNLQNGVNSAISTGQIGSNSKARSRANAAGGAGGAGGSGVGTVTNTTTMSSGDTNIPPSIFAPALVTSNDTCGGSASGGGSGTTFGFLIGWVFPMAGCEARADANTALRLGRSDIAFERMCQRDNFREAAKRAGTPCAADRPPEPQPVQMVAMHPATPRDPRPSRADCLRLRRIADPTQVQRDYLVNCN